MGVVTVAHILPMSDDLFDEMHFYAQAKRRAMREAVERATCPLCGCLRPDDPERCDICGHHGCQGCVKDGLCSLCFDIEKERHD